jgi:hypothetical protein
VIHAGSSRYRVGMDDLVVAFDSWLPDHNRLFYVYVAVLGVSELIARFARRSGIELGIPIAQLVEDYPGSIGTPRDVDLGPHLHDVGQVEWLSDTRLLLLPIGGKMNIHGGAGSRSATLSEFVCVGDLRVDAPPGTIRFRTRVLLRITPLVAVLAFIAMTFSIYAPAPWGMSFPVPASVLKLFGPALLFGCVIGVGFARARVGVLTAHHVVTGAFMAAAASGGRLDSETTGGTPD